MSKIKNGGLDQYGAGPFKQQQFGTAGTEGDNNDDINVVIRVFVYCLLVYYIFVIFHCVLMAMYYLDKDHPRRSLFSGSGAA